MAVAVAAGKIHSSIRRDRIALKDLLDQTDALEELAPVKGRHQPQTADQVGDERLFGRLMPRLRTDRVLNRLTTRGQRRIELLTQRCCRFVLARSLKQTNDKCRVYLGWPPGADVRWCIECLDQ